MTALLTENLPLLASAPNGIKKLRELILELAVRGKLLPQDPCDEPARELLKRVAEEKAGLEAKGKIKKQKPVTEISEDEAPFDLPQGWEWSRLDQISSNIQYGFTASANHQSLEPLLLRITDIQNDKVNWASVPGCNVPPSEIAGYELVDGDIVIARTGGTIGKSYLVSGLTQLAVFASYLIRIGRLDTTYSKYTKVFLGSQLYWKQLYANSMGTGQPNVNGTALKGLLISLPPLAEQHRIVTKVDELMTLCDRLEAQQADAESAHARLVQALLDSLTQVSDATDFVVSWQRLAEHFHTLFTTESSIDTLKQSLLQLAVMGKLVPQNTNCTELDGMPSGWCIKKIDEFCNVQGGIQKTPLRRPVSQHFPYLRVANVQRGRIDVKELERYELSLDELEKWRLSAGDLLIVEGNGSESEIGRCAIWYGEVKDCVYQNHLIRVRPKIADEVRYLALYLNSPIGMAHMKRLAITTSGLFNLSVGKIRSIPVGLPPLTEQHRIVAKVDALMTLCDQLKTRLTQARQLNEELASTLVEQAVA